MANVSKKKKSFSILWLILSCIAACSDENTTVDAPINEQTLIKTEKAKTLPDQQVITTTQETGQTEYEDEKASQNVKLEEASSNKNPLEQKANQLLDELAKTREENIALRKKVEELLKQSQEHRKILQSQQ